MHFPDGTYANFKPMEFLMIRPGLGVDQERGINLRNVAVLPASADEESRGS